MNVVQLLHASVLRNPQHPCLLFKDNDTYRSWSYTEVWSKILAFAGALKQLGIDRGDKVALMAETSPEWVICDFAVMSLGAVVVPIYPSVPPKDASYILKNADVLCMIAENAHFVETLDSLWPLSMSSAIVLHGEAGSCSVPSHTFESLLQKSNSPLDSATIDEIETNALATIVHTSGTSGRPKGVMLSHRNLVSNIEACLSILTVKPDDIALSYLPLSHIFERTVGHFCLLASGATIAYAESIESIQQNLLEVRPTVLVTVPRLLEKVYTGIMQRLEKAPKFLQHLVQTKSPSWIARKTAEKLVYAKLRAGLGGRIRAVVSGGAGLAKQIAAFYQAAGIPVVEGYGMTESAPVIAVNPLDAIRPGTVGLPLHNVQVRLAEDDELLVKGPNVMAGYFGDPVSTTEAIDLDGWLHTGDIAEIDYDGYVRIVDRKKNLLVLATGKNVPPFPIENAMTLSPYIADAVLIGDGLKYVSCLIVPDFTALKDKAVSVGLPEGDYKSWTNDFEIRGLLQREIRRALEEFAEFEQPKRAYLLNAPFTMESGELTPTLKVRTKIILKKYSAEIEDMYAGREFLDIYGHPDTGLSGGTDPADGPPPPTTSEPKRPSSPKSTDKPQTFDAAATQDASRVTDTQARHRRKSGLWKTSIFAVVVILAVLGLGENDLLGGHNPTSGHGLSANFNLLGNIRQVHKNNNQINAENNKVVRGMNAVKNLSSLTPKMSSQLHGLDAGLVQQNNSLNQLSDLSEQEIGLSKQFGALASSLNSALNSVSSSTSTQEQSVNHMASTAADLATLASKVESINQEIHSKLNQATTGAKQVSSEVP